MKSITKYEKVAWCDLLALDLLPLHVDNTLDPTEKKKNVYSNRKCIFKFYCRSRCKNIEVCKVCSMKINIFS